jgi:hypothetical protein
MQLLAVGFAVLWTVFIDNLGDVANSQQPTANSQQLHFIPHSQ